MITYLYRMSTTQKHGRRGRPTDQAARSAKIAHILEAARTCVVRDGFHRAATADICREAGISPANLYQYFASKDDIIVAIAQEYHAADLALLADLERADGLIAGLAAALERIVADLREDPGYPALRVEILAEANRNPRVRAVVAAAEQEIQGALSRMIAAAQARGEVSDRLPPDDAASLCLSIFDGIFARQAAFGFAMPTESLEILVRRALEHDR